jgi:chromosome segregation ATPase
MQIDKM